MTQPPLADSVLPLIRTRDRELWKLGRANYQGGRMREGVGILEAAEAELDADNPAYSGEEIFDVTHRSLASAMKIIARADDSSGIIGGVIHSLIALHARLSPYKKTSNRKFAEWFIAFHQNPDVDYFELDPVAYREGLGDDGLALVRAQVEQWRNTAALKHTDGYQPYIREDSLVRHFDERFAVLDRDIDAINKAYHDQPVKQARALAEISEFDLAIAAAEAGIGSDWGPRQDECANLLLDLISKHQPDRLEEVARWVVERRPTARFASAYLAALPAERTAAAYEEMLEVLTGQPYQRASFMFAESDDDLATLRYIDDHGVDAQHLREDLAERIFAAEPVIATRVHLDGIAERLVEANSKRYRPAARRIVKVRKKAQAAGSAEAVDAVDAFVSDLRRRYSNRPSLRAALEAAGL
ncbi:DUF6880 family protein [Corynebacterium cystitidis]|uniref:DUF6880 family protein n=1 Tax=Corynebacterium cystitidis TaxID=35757 RepID=UPI00211ECF87|nr:DUF6880 family protein [Corynebacterium cystitidis]